MAWNSLRSRWVVVAFVVLGGIFLALHIQQSEEDADAMAALAAAETATVDVAPRLIATSPPPSPAPKREAGGVVAKTAPPSPRTDQASKTAVKRLQNITSSSGVRRVGAVHPDDANCFIYDDAPGRCAPHWVIIGALKCGTTSVYTWLGLHPNVALLGDMVEDEEVETEWAAKLRVDRPLRFKEIGFFKSPAAGADVNAYLRYFPAIAPGDGRMSGEGSVQYFFSSGAPDALRTWMPAAKFILLIRDPVERIFSRYQHTSTLYLTKPGQEQALARLFGPKYATAKSVATETAIEASRIFAPAAVEGARVCVEAYEAQNQEYSHLMSCWLSKNQIAGQTAEKALKAFANDANLARTQFLGGVIEVAPTPHGLLPYFPALLTTLTRLKSIEHSIYYPQVKNFLRVFTLEQLLIVRSEDLFVEPGPTMDAITAFVDLPPFDWAPVVNSKYNAMRDEKGRVTLVAEKPTLPPKYPFDPEIRALLEAFYGPLNAKLNELVGRDFGWSYK